MRNNVHYVWGRGILGGDEGSKVPLGYLTPGGVVFIGFGACLKVKVPSVKTKYLGVWVF